MAGYGSPFYTQSPMFPQPNGNVYLINNSLEVANIPAGAGITAALCSSENLLYLKTMQNGVPTLLVYKLQPYTEASRQMQATPTIEERLAALEQKVNSLGGKTNDVSTTTAKTEGWDT